MTWDDAPCLFLAVSALLLPGCSRLGGVSVGPMVARPSAMKASYGDELRLRHGAGSSDGSELSVFEFEGRLALTQRVGAVGVSIGPAYVRWLGPMALMARASGGFGAEYFDHTVFASAAAHGGFGLGFVLESSEQEQPRRGPWLAVPQPELGGSMRRRERTLLTLEPTGSVDAHVRGVTLSAALLIGLSWSEEEFFVASPPRPSPLLFVR
jgi:hypothetical protein